MIYNTDSRLAEIILHHPQIIPLLNRFGIKLGIGQSSVLEVACRHGVDVHLLLAVINTSINPSYFPEEELLSIPVERIEDYLRATDNHYRDVQLPNIRRHFHVLVQRSDSSTQANLGRLLEFFDNTAQSLCKRMDEDNLVATDSEVADSIDDLVSLFVIHLQGQYDENICYAVINALLDLQRDLRINERIRERILQPLINLRKR